MPEESTTPDLVELVRSAFEAYNRRDLDAVMPFFAPDAVLDATRTLGIAPHGRVAIRGLIEDWIGAYDEVEMVLEEPLDLGSGVVYAVVRQRARPLGTSSYVQSREGFVWVLAEGLIVNLTVYPEANIHGAPAAAERLAQERGRRGEFR
jgi:ketosteroid isomerase-like protein